MHHVLRNSQAFDAGRTEQSFECSMGTGYEAPNQELPRFLRDGR